MRVLQLPRDPVVPKLTALQPGESYIECLCRHLVAMAQKHSVPRAETAARKTSYA